MTTPTPLKSNKLKGSAVPTEEQTTLRVSRTLHEKLKILSAMESQSLMDLTQSIFTDFARRLESASGQSLSAPTWGNAATVAKSSIPVAETTTIRVPRVLHERIKTIAALYGSRSLMDLTEAVYTEHLQLYEAISGRTLATRGSMPALTEQLAG